MATSDTARLIDAAGAGRRLDHATAFRFVDAPLELLVQAAESVALMTFGRTVTHSRNVFIPLTQLCRDMCHYCCGDPDHFWGQ